MAVNGFNSHETRHERTNESNLCYNIFSILFLCELCALRGILLLDHNGRLIVEIEAVESRAVVRN